MSKKLILLLAAVLALGVFTAGCGGDDDESGDEPAAETTTEDTTIPEDGSAEGDASGEGDLSEQAAAACRQLVDTASGQLSDDERSELEDLCEEAAAGDAEAGREVCERVVEASLPEGDARDQAIQACSQASP